MASQVIATFNNIGTILFYGWPFILLIILFIARSLMKKYPIDVVIIEKRGDNLIKTNDRCGRMNDGHTGMTYYHLKKSKDNIPIYNYDWVLHNVTIPTNILEKLISILQGNIGTIFLFKYGSKQYKPIDINIKSGMKPTLQEIKDNEGNSVYVNIYQQFDPREKLGILDFAVIDWDNMNFMVQEQRASTERRRKKGEWLKQVLIPLTIIMGAVLVSIFMLKFSLDASRNMPGAVKQAQSEGGGSKTMDIIGNAFAPGE